MENKVVIITGGSSGMGKAMAKQFALEGYRVVITGRNLEKLETTKKEIEQDKDQILCFQMDVRDPMKAEGMVRVTHEAFGRIDGLINNAAGNFICPAEELSLNGWHAVINIVLNGTWYCSQAVGRYWIDNKKAGSMLNILATYAFGAGAGVIHSASAKAGVLAMTRTLALEWGTKYGIRVNAVAPGPISNTGGNEQLLHSKEAYQKTVNTVPLRRFGELQEIADLASFLFSGKADYINGECIFIDGGMVLNTKRQFLDL